MINYNLSRPVRASLSRGLQPNEPVEHALSLGQLVSIYRAMLTARLIDQRELALVKQGQAFFHVSGAGHEATAALGPHLTQDDWLHCHYRDKALLVHRGVPIESFFTGLLCKAESSSAGRQMSAHLSDPGRNILSMVGPVGNNALQAVGVAAAIRDQPSRPVVLCSVGDGTTQQGEFLEACAEAVRHQLPVLFLVEDNEWAISTATTGQTFFSRPDGPARDFYGMPIRRLDGSDAIAGYRAYREVVARMRADRQPALVLCRVKRLSDHTNADDQTLYRSGADIQASWEHADPLRMMEQKLQAIGMLDEDLREIRDETETAVRAAEEEALRGREPNVVLTAKRPLPAELASPSVEYRGADEPARLTMREAMRDVLRWHLEHDPSVFLYGQDIEDKKGDVFGVTQGLSTAFPGRVVNSPLSESTIVGTAVGRALAGERPVAFIQFADFLPLAYNQIASELGSMYWRTNGGWQAPVIVMITCGGYRPGLGPFHAQSLEAIAAHTPGVDVVMPSTAADAAGLLNAAFASGRPTLFFYPKAALNQTQVATSPDVHRQLVPVGVARTLRPGRDLTVVGWGNTVALCLKVADALHDSGGEAEVIDLRSLSPWDEESVLRSVEKTGRLLVVDEDNRSCGMGAEVVATAAEKARRPVRCRRVTRPDTFVPCNFGNQLEVLPSFRTSLMAAAEILDMELTWDEPSAPPEDGLCIVPAIGSGPSDESVTVLELSVRPGNRVRAGDAIAAVEASKAAFEMIAPTDGVVESVFVEDGATIEVGQPFLAIRGAEGVGVKKPITHEPAARPRLRRQARPASRANGTPSGYERTVSQVGLAAVAAVTGSRRVSNEELLAFHVGRTPEDILRRTGIEARQWVGPGEDALSLAVEACRSALRQTGLGIRDVDLVICSTGSPLSITPSLACRVLAELADRDATELAHAYDLNAACSGYLYALRAAYDFLQSHPNSRALVLTSEVLSSRTDRDDFDTAFLFGDAASATILVGEGLLIEAKAQLFGPAVAAKGETGAVLSVPFPQAGGAIAMNGSQVFTEAVRSMATMLHRACNGAGIEPSQLSLVVPHQANQRILDAVGKRIARPVFSNIRRLGNTSSSTIPLALQDVLPDARPGMYLGLCAFGGGFTFGGAVLKMLRSL